MLYYITYAYLALSLAALALALVAYTKRNDELTAGDLTLFVAVSFTPIANIAIIFASLYELTNGSTSPAWFSVVLWRRAPSAQEEQ